MARSGPLTYFGRTMRDLAESRGYYSWQELANALNAAGWGGSRATLSNWAHGRYAADYEMLPYLVEALQLHEDEKLRLATAFSYGQSPRGSSNHQTA